MTQKKAIVLSAILGSLVLVIVLVTLRPVERFEAQYTMDVVSGKAVSGAATDEFSTKVDTENKTRTTSVVSGASINTMGSGDSTYGLINPSGMTLESRINTPSGYSRIPQEDGSLGSFLRSYKLKKDGAKVLLYNKSEKQNQDAHIAVFKLPIENEDLQQCADSVMRVYAEYFWHTDQKDRISFKLTDGFDAEYKKWRDGYRINIGENSSSWYDAASYDPSYANFKKYLRIVFAYASTESMKTESKKISDKDIDIGDVFLHAGAPGHVVMVVDMCESESGKKAFLLAQGYMPAQQFQLLKNPAHTDDAWYYTDELVYPFKTPEYTFENGSLRRLSW